MFETSHNSTVRFSRKKGSRGGRACPCGGILGYSSTSVSMWVTVQGSEKALSKRVKPSTDATLLDISSPPDEDGAGWQQHTGRKVLA